MCTLVVTRAGRSGQRSRNGDTYDDPSEDALFELLSDISAGDALWITVEKLSDATGQNYAQAL
jgi:hypothetical protein